MSLGYLATHQSGLYGWLQSSDWLKPSCMITACTFTAFVNNNRWPKSSRGTGFDVKYIISSRTQIRDLRRGGVFARQESCNFLNFRARHFLENFHFIQGNDAISFLFFWRGPCDLDWACGYGLNDHPRWFWRSFKENKGEAKVLYHVSIKCHVNKSPKSCRYNERHNQLGILEKRA